MHRDASISRIRYTLVTAVVAALLLPALATAKDHPRGAGKSRQVERLRQIEKQRLQALAAPTALARPADTPPAVAKALVRGKRRGLHARRHPRRVVPLRRGLHARRHPRGVVPAAGRAGPRRPSPRQQRRRERNDDWARHRWKPAGDLRHRGYRQPHPPNRARRHRRVSTAPWGAGHHTTPQGRGI
jgi:hypothetical protein